MTIKLPGTKFDIFCVENDYKVIKIADFSISIHQKEKIIKKVCSVLPIKIELVLYADGSFILYFLGIKEEETKVILIHHQRKHMVH